MQERTLGYILIVVGIVVVGFAFFSMFSVFTAKSEPYSVFQTRGIALDLSNLADEENLTAEQREEFSQSGALRTELVERNVVDRVLNMISFSMFMFFTAWIGFKLAELGTKLVRPIKVKVNQAK